MNKPLSPRARMLAAYTGAPTDFVIECMVEKTRAAFSNTRARSIFIGSIWLSISLLSSQIWCAWDQPVLEAITHAARELGRR